MECVCGGGFTYHNWVPKNAWSLGAGWGTGTQVKTGGRKRKREAEMEGESEEKQRGETITKADEEAKVRISDLDRPRADPLKQRES